MTLGDVIAMVAGVGLGMASAPRLSAAGTSPQLALIFSLTWGFWALAVMLAVVILARLVRHRRQAYPAEWLAILLTVAGLAYRPEFGLDRVVSLVFRALKTRELTFASLRWALAAGTLAEVAVLLLALRVGRRALPPWAKSALLAVAAGLALWGPVDVIALQGPDLLTPSAGFPAGDGWALYRKACVLIALTPFGLVFGVPAVAALAERVARRPWTWAEWSSFVLAITSAALLWSFIPGDFGRVSPAWAAERGMVVAWLVGVGLISRWITVRARRIWVDGGSLARPGRESPGIVPNRPGGDRAGP